MNITWKYADKESPRQYLDCVVLNSDNQLAIAWLDNNHKWIFDCDCNAGEVTAWMPIPRPPDKDDIIHSQSFTG